MTMDFTLTIYKTKVSDTEIITKGCRMQARDRPIHLIDRHKPILSTT